MKLKNIGRAALALAASAVTVLGMTSCTLGYTVGYLFITGSTPNNAGSGAGQIASYRIKNNDGTLRVTSTVGSGGSNPIQVVVNSAGTYLYVLNQMGGTDTNPIKSQIALFSIGGYGAVTFQASFIPQGYNTRNIAISGNYLYALDEFAPGVGTGGTAHQSYGDISAFAVDNATGRLSAITNQQQTDPTNRLPLTYFPVGTDPTWMAVNGTYAFVAEQGPASGATTADPRQAVFIYNQNANTGQLTLTQNAPTPTGASQLTYVYPAGGYIYLLDAGPPDTNSTGSILPYTVSTGGVLAAVSGGARPNNGQSQSPVGPTSMIKETSHPFLWVANSGINTSVGTVGGNVITAYVIQSPTGQLFPAQTSGNGETSGTGTRCLVEDPSNNYVYAVNFNDSTISGKKINQQTGGLDSLVKGMPPPPGSPTWCATTGSTF